MSRSFSQHFVEDQDRRVVRFEIFEFLLESSQFFLKSYLVREALLSLFGRFLFEIFKGRVARFDLGEKRIDERGSLLKTEGCNEKTAGKRTFKTEGPKMVCFQESVF